MRKDSTCEQQGKSKKKEMGHLPKHLEHINKMAAGIDVGSKSHFVAVPPGCDTVCVREFESFTSDLHVLANWLKTCKVETVVMESTGVYWIPLYELLESYGFEVKLVDARSVKNVTGRKTDVLDCQWLQQLHTYGLLNGAFRPSEQICALRAYLRHRSMLVQQAAMHIQHMQKSLSQMNIQLHNVLSDITGETGMKIIRSMAAGERSGKVLASHRNPGCKNSMEVIEKSLEGNYRPEHIFGLTQALELYDIYQGKIAICDTEIEKQLSSFEDCAAEGSKELPVKKKTKSHCKNASSFDVASHLIRMTGVDLTTIPGLEASSALKIISEIGLDMSRWKNSKHFASWLGLCPGNKVSGGKRLGGRSKRTSNYAASILRIAASTLHHSKSALGAFFRRMKSRLGAQKAVTATAHKIAVTLFMMLTRGTQYVEAGQTYYEDKYRERVIKNLRNRAREMGFSLIEAPIESMG